MASRRSWVQVPLGPQKSGKPAFFYLIFKRIWSKVEYMRKKEKINEVLRRGIDTILPSKKRLAELMEKKRLRIYFGVDPTSPNLHLGHSVPLRKLRQFQELGHNVIFLVGDFTARIGDPSDKEKARKPMAEEQIRENMKNYIEQAAKILDIKKVQIAYNSKWLSKMKFADILELSSHFTISRLLERDMFQRRLKNGEEVWLSEILYPIMQGYDSVALNVDLEIGSTDQTFNMLVGRKLQKIYNNKEKFILTTPLLLGPDGQKMSKSIGNTINLSDPPQEMYGKIMSIKDELIEDYFLLCTDVAEQEIKKMKKDIENDRLNPKDAKEKLAFEITAFYWGREQAKKARQEFCKVFQRHQLPEKMPTFFAPRDSYPLSDLLVFLDLAKSKSEAKRLINQNAVKIYFKNNRFEPKNWKEEIRVEEGMVIQTGKRKFARLTKKDK